MFRSCKFCRFYIRDREAAMRCMGKVVYRCSANEGLRVDNPFRKGIFCKTFKKKD